MKQTEAQSWRPEQYSAMQPSSAWFPICISLMSLILCVRAKTTIAPAPISIYTVFDFIMRALYKQNKWL